MHTCHCARALRFEKGVALKSAVVCRSHTALRDSAATRVLQPRARAAQKLEDTLPRHVAYVSPRVRVERVIAREKKARANNRLG